MLLQHHYNWLRLITWKCNNYDCNLFRLWLYLEVIIYIFIRSNALVIIMNCVSATLTSNYLRVIPSCHFFTEVNYQFNMFIVTSSHCLNHWLLIRLPGKWRNLPNTHTKCCILLNYALVIRPISFQIIIIIIWTIILT